MRLKKILTFLGLLVLLFLVVSLIMTYIGYSKAKKIDSSTSFTDYFPFGRGGVFDKINNIVINPGNGEGNIAVDEEPNNRLIKVSDKPIAGYTFIQKEFYPESTPVIDTNTEQEITVTPFGTFERELAYGSRGEDVKRLQQTLNACPELGLAQTGPGSSGRETEVFVERTLSAVKKFQLKFKDELITGQNLTDPSGVLDPLTREKISKPFVCKTISSSSPAVKPGAVLKTVVRYIEKSTGNVYDFLPETKETSRLTNQTIPRISEAYFGQNGNTVFLRYVKDDNQTIETYFATVPKQILGGDSDEGQLEGYFLERNITDFTLNPQKDSAYIQTIASTSAQGGIFSVETGDKKQFFFFAFFRMASTMGKKRCYYYDHQSEWFCARTHV